MDNDIRNRLRGRHQAHAPQRPEQPTQDGTQNLSTKYKYASTSLWKVLTILSLVIGVSTGAYIIYSKNHENPQPPATQAGTKSQNNPQTSQSPNVSSFSKPTQAAAKTDQGLYYPTSMPKGYTSNNDFEVINSNVVTYSIKDSEGNVYSVTQQPTPANFDLNVYANTLTDVSRFTTPVGNAIIGTNHTALIASIETQQKAWVLINAPDSKLKSQLEAIVKSLRPVSG